MIRRAKKTASSRRNVVQTEFRKKRVEKFFPMRRELKAFIAATWADLGEAASSPIR
jgi:hypothetical protein